MRKGITSLLIFCLCLLVFFVHGCGSPGGGAEFFETVMVTANCNVTTLDSDVISRQIANSDFFTGSACLDCLETIESDVVSVKIEATSLLQESENEGDIEILPSAVRVESVYIEYLPSDTSTVPLPAQRLALGQVVKPSQSVDIQIRALSGELKKKLLNDNVMYDTNSYDFYDINPLNSFDPNCIINCDPNCTSQLRACLNAMYFTEGFYKSHNYFVRLTFHAVEIESNISGDFSTDFTLHVSDFLSEGNDVDDEVCLKKSILMGIYYY